jgi:hypothetical protein
MYIAAQKFWRRGLRLSLVPTFVPLSGTRFSATSLPLTLEWALLSDVYIISFASSFAAQFQSGYTVVSLVNA